MPADASAAFPDRERQNEPAQYITEEELRSQLRQQGVEKLEQVKRACLEANGEISVVKKDRAADGAQRKSKKPI